MLIDPLSLRTAMGSREADLEMAVLGSGWEFSVLANFDRPRDSGLETVDVELALVAWTFCRLPWKGGILGVHVEGAANISDVLVG